MKTFLVGVALFGSISGMEELVERNGDSAPGTRSVQECEILIQNLESQNQSLTDSIRSATGELTTITTNVRVGIPTLSDEPTRDLLTQITDHVEAVIRMFPDV
jgi:DNA-binding ferritin-like protein